MRRVSYLFLYSKAITTKKGEEEEKKKEISKEGETEPNMNYNKLLL